MKRYDREKMNRLASEALNTTNINSLKNALDSVLSPIEGMINEANVAKGLAEEIGEIENTIKDLEQAEEKDQNAINEARADLMKAENAKKSLQDKSRILGAVETKLKNLANEVSRVKGRLR